MRKRHYTVPGSVVFKAFHGTRQHLNVLKPSIRGTFDPGIYLANYFAAQQYAGADGIVLTAQVTLCSTYYYLASFDHDVDLDSPAVDLVRGLFSQGGGRKFPAVGYGYRRGIRQRDSRGT